MNAAYSQANPMARVMSLRNFRLLFAIPGILVLLITAWMAFQPDLKDFSESLTAAQTKR